MRKKITLICTQCLSRNYQTTKSQTADSVRLELKKFCPKCNSYQIHKETK